jgi:hypothetical protein
LTIVEYIFQVSTGQLCITLSTAFRLEVNTQTILLDEPKEVDVEAIERELSQPWKEASEPIEGEVASPVVGACSFNLVVVNASHRVNSP